MGLSLPPLGESKIASPAPALAEGPQPSQFEMMTVHLTSRYCKHYDSGSRNFDSGLQGMSKCESSDLADPARGVC
jgi:hypothetical protein